MFSTIFSRTFIIFMFVFGTIKLAKSRCLPLDFYSNNGLTVTSNGERVQDVSMETDEKTSNNVDTKDVKLTVIEKPSAQIARLSKLNIPFVKASKRITKKPSSTIKTYSSPALNVKRSEIPHFGDLRSFEKDIPRSPGFYVPNIAVFRSTTKNPLRSTQKNYSPPKTEKSMDSSRSDTSGGHTTETQHKRFYVPNLPSTKSGYKRSQYDKSPAISVEDHRPKITFTKSVSTKTASPMNKPTTTSSARSSTKLKGIHDELKSLSTSISSSVRDKTTRKSFNPTRAYYPVPSTSVEPVEFEYLASRESSESLRNDDRSFHH